jgi:hypothetical protein
MAFSLVGIGLKVAEYALERGVSHLLSNSSSPVPVVRILDSTFDPKLWDGRCLYVKNPLEEEIVISGITASRPELQVARDIRDDIQWLRPEGRHNFGREVRIPPKMAREFPVRLVLDAYSSMRNRRKRSRLKVFDRSEPDDCYLLIHWRTHKDTERPVRYDCKISDIMKHDDTHREVMQPR